MLTIPGIQPLTPERAQLCIPLSQLEDFYQESAPARKFILDWICFLEPLRHAKGRSKLFALVADRIGDNAGNVKNRYYAWDAGLKGKCSPVWEKLVDRRAWPKPGDKALDIRFLEYWRGLRETQKRLNDGCRQAHRDLLSDLASWEAAPHDRDRVIPGYTSPPARESYCITARQHVPSGWSYRNLARHVPRAVQLVNVIVGPKAASLYLPSNLGTRVGLEYREILFSDDQDYDNSVISGLNRGEAMRPQGFNTLDYLTGHFEMYGVQLRRRDAETGKRRGLDQEAYVWTILSDLIVNGFRDDARGTRLIREHATAKGYTKQDGHGDSFDDVLHHITGGRVTLDASGRFDQSMFAQMFFGGSGGKQAAGNFKYKAPLESAFHRVRTQSAGLLGDTGNRYQVTPEHNEAIDRYEMRLFKAIDKLPSSESALVYDLLRHHKHTFDEFLKLTHLVYRAVNHRRDHKLEGWASAGFVVPGYALPDPLDASAAPRIITREQFAVMETEQQHYINTFARDHTIVMTPSEARDLCRSRDRAIAKLKPSLAITALPVSWAYPRRKGKDGGVKVKPNGTLVITDPARFGSESLIYLAVAHMPDGSRVHLDTGSQYLVHICPFAPDEAWLLGLDGRYRGIVKLMPRVCGNDIETRLRNQGAINQYRADLTRDTVRRHEGRVAQGEEIIAHNERVVSGEIRPSEEAVATARYHHLHDIADAAEDDGIITVRPDAPAPPSIPSNTNSDRFKNIFANNPNLD